MCLLFVLSVIAVVDVIVVCLQRLTCFDVFVIYLASF